ncbi:MAG: LysR family transcriptional regulator [Pseudomonadota bacterium]
MDWRSTKFDWNQARAFLVTAEEGSLSAAARSLDVAQPTLGRQVRSLEEALGVALFERVGRGLVLTPSGAALVEHVRAMGDAATQFSLTALGRSQAPEGKVTISATEVAAAFVLPEILVSLRKAHPGITLEIVASNSLSDLRRREADIAIRSVRPSDPELFARKLSSQRARLYAAHAYLDGIGEPADEHELAKAQFIGFRDNAPFEEGLRAWGVPVTAASFPVLCADHSVQWEMVKRGLGIGVMDETVGDAEPLVRPAAPWLAPFPVDVWLVAHREISTSKRVRIVFDHLAKALRKATAT